MAIITAKRPGAPRNVLPRLLADNRQVDRRIELVRNEAGDETALYLYDAIVSDALTAEWWGGVCAQDLVPQIREIAGGTLHLRINSPGGDVFAGQAIAQALRECKAKVVAHVDGIAASAASVVMIAAGEIEIAEGGFVMIHKSSTLAWGNADDLLSTAELLAQVDDSIAGQYARRTGMGKADLLAWMASETWMSADAAVEHKFCDRVATGTSADARWNLGAYGVAPGPVQTSARPAPHARADRGADFDAAVSAAVDRRLTADREANAFTATLRRRAQLAALRT